jgi:hypothetical protein
LQTLVATDDDSSSLAISWQAVLDHLQSAQEIIDVVAPASVLGARCNELIESATETCAAQVDGC